MAVKIRLKRMGKKKQPSYRVVVADSRAPRDGRIIELLGRYDPRQDPSLVEIDNERAKYWLSSGAQPTERVRKILEISGAVARSKVSRSGVYRLDHEAKQDPPEAIAEPAPDAKAPQDSSAAVEADVAPVAQAQDEHAAAEESQDPSEEASPEAVAEEQKTEVPSPEPVASVQEATEVSAPESDQTEADASEEAEEKKDA